MQTEWGVKYLACLSVRALWMPLVMVTVFSYRLVCGIEADEDSLNHPGSEEEQVDVDEPAHAPPVEELIEHSGKMVFLVHLMENLRNEKHRTIIFSQSRKMLDIIQKVLLSLVSIP